MNTTCSNNNKCRLKYCRLYLHHVNRIMKTKYYEVVGSRRHLIIFKWRRSTNNKISITGVYIMKKCACMRGYVAAPKLCVILRYYSIDIVIFTNVDAKNTWVLRYDHGIPVVDQHAECQSNQWRTAEPFATPRLIFWFARCSYSSFQLFFHSSTIAKLDYYYCFSLICF